MSPILERQPESFDSKSLTEELPHFQPGQGDTPSPRTPSTNGSPSPPLLPIVSEPIALSPILAEDGIPYDHTLPEYLRQVAGEPTLEDICNMTLRVLTETSSLQQMSVYTPNLRELNLDGSALTSLRDIGSELRFLHTLRIGRCRLQHLDGTLGLTSLRELYATGNYITSAAPCAHLSKLRVLDLSRLKLYEKHSCLFYKEIIRNHIQEMRTLGFLSSCRHLAHISFEGNHVTTNPQLANFLQITIPSLQSIDGTFIGSEDHEHANSVSSDSRVSSASSHSSSMSAQPGTSAGTPSKLTSGQILCGNIAVQRRRGSSPLRETENTTNDVIESSKNWQNALYKFRETNWKDETKLENSNSDESE